MGFAIRDIDSGAAAVLPTFWLVIRPADGRIIGDAGTHGAPDSEGGVEIGYSLAPSARPGHRHRRGGRPRQALAVEPGTRRVTAVTGPHNTASRRLLERQRFRLTGILPGTGEVRCTLNLS